MTIEEMLDQLETLGRRKTDRMIFESILYYFGSIMLNKYKFNKHIGSSKNIKYYSICFANSGIGKSYAVNKLKEMFSLENYGKTMMMFYENMLNNLSEEIADAEEIKRYMPKSSIINVEGTSEGLFQVAQSQLASGYGSLNTYNDEFTDTIISSSGLISRLKQLYDGEFQAKIIKGGQNGEQGELKQDLSGIICNFLGLGSKKSITSDAAKELKRIASSGLYRRTFIIDSKKYVEKNNKEENIEQLKEYLLALEENHKATFKSLLSTGIDISQSFTYSQEYLNRIEEIDDDLISRAHNDKLNEFAQYNTGSLEMVVDLSHIIAFLEWDNELNLSHINKAYDFMIRTRGTIEDTFKSIHPYKIMYDLLKLKDNMTISEMAEYEHIIPTASNKIKDSLALLEELCYRKGEVLIKNEGKVTRYSIENLPYTDMHKIIISTSDEGKGKYAINYTPGELDWKLFPKLVTSKNIESFTTVHYEPSARAPDGHRRAESAIEGQNLIAFDIDEGMTIQEARAILQEYTYLIYTTKSHQKDKNGSVCDRFRILMPTKTKFYVTDEQHKQLYQNIEKVLGITSNDPQTRNISRLFYSNPDAEVFTNEGELVNIDCCIPSTEKADRVMPILNEIQSQEYSDDESLNKREQGMLKFVVMNSNPGSRNELLFRYVKFLQDINSSNIPTKVHTANQMTIDPLPTKEVEQILRSAKV